MNEHTDTTLESDPETALESANGDSGEDHADIPGFWSAVWMAIKGTSVDYT